MGRYDAPGGFSPGTAQFPGPSLHSPPSGESFIVARLLVLVGFWVSLVGCITSLIERIWMLVAGRPHSCPQETRERPTRTCCSCLPIPLNRSCSCRQAPFEDGEGDESESISWLLHYGAPKQHDKASASQRAASAGGIGRFLHSSCSMRVRVIRMSEMPGGEGHGVLAAPLPALPRFSQVAGSFMAIRFSSGQPCQLLPPALPVPSSRRLWG